MDGFAAWQVFNALSPRKQRAIDAFREHGPKDTCFSIIVPVCDKTRERLYETIACITAQSYSNFELILVGDAGVTQTDNRIRSLGDSAGSGAAAINQAVEAAQGAFLVLLDQGGRMQENTLLLLADYIEQHTDTDIVYGDDAVLDAGSGKISDPRFKPDWSPELLLSRDYTAPLRVLRTSLYKTLGGCRPDVDGAHIHDLLLRASERARHAGHLPQLLFHRFDEAPPLDSEVGCNAVAEAFARRGVDCTVTRPQWARKHGMDIRVPEMPQEGPSVAIIIATKNNRAILDRLLTSLRRTNYKNYKVCIADNVSDDEATLAYLKSLEHHVIQIADPAGSFSYAHLNNRAVEQVDAEYVLFLNDDTSVIDPDWLGQMMGWARLPGVGAVGARLLFPDGRVQHGGVVLGLRRGLTAFRGLAGDDPGYLGFAKSTRNCSAVTAAAMLTPRALFLEMGGFDETAFAVSYNDVDYCLRLGDAGYRVVYCGEAELHHHQGYTRGGGSTSPLERAELGKRYGARADPYYSPHLGLDGQDFAIKPTVVPPLPLERPIRVLFCTEALDGSARPLLELLSGLERDGAISLTTLKRSPAWRAQGDYEQWLADMEAGAGFDGFDVAFAKGAGCFWAIDAARRGGVPSIWALREHESPERFRELPRDVAGVARACFNAPYRVVFASEPARRRWADFDRLDNFDLASWGPDPSPNAQLLKRFIEGAAFSAVPGA